MLNEIFLGDDRSKNNFDVRLYEKSNLSPAIRTNEKSEYF